MGLAIRAYRKMTKIKNVVIDEEDPVLDDGLVVIVRANQDWPERLEGVEGGVYRSLSILDVGKIGSYSSYSSFRNELAKLSFQGRSASDVWAETEMGHLNEGPFFELINFSDCDGLIGPKISSKLSKDFAEWNDRAYEHFVPYDYERYKQLRLAFEFASDNGVVKFC